MPDRSVLARAPSSGQNGRKRKWRGQSEDSGCDMRTDWADRRRLPARPSRYRPSVQVPPTSRTDVTRSIGMPLLPLASDIEPVREDPLCEPPAVLLPVLPVEPVALPPAVDPAPAAEPVLEEPVLEEPVLDDPPARFCSVPFTSTRLPTSVEKFEALPVKRYDVPLALIVELLPVEPAPVVLPVALPVAPPAVLPVGLPVEPVVPVADPVVDDEEPAPIDASVRM